MVFVLLDILVMCSLCCEVTCQQGLGKLVNGEISRDGRESSQSGQCHSARRPEPLLGPLFDRSCRIQQMALANGLSKELRKRSEGCRKR